MTVPIDYLHIALAATCLTLALLAAWLHFSRQSLRSTITDRDAKIALGSDIDARLAENEERLRKIIATEPECVKVQAHDGTIIEMNPAGLDLVEAEIPEQIVGHSVFNFVAPEFHDDYRRLSESVLRGQTETLEFQIISLKKRRLWMETHAAPLRDANGSVVALLAITRDISARKLYEHQLQRESRELAHASRLHNMAQLATMLAHELNQPLTAIANYSRGCLRRIAAREDCEEISTAIHEISSQAIRAANIIRSVRAYVSDKDGGHHPLSVNDVISDALMLADVEARASNVRIQKELSPALPLVCGDGTQLEQVVLNIVRNGVEAMADLEDRERVLTIRSNVGPGGSIRIDVTDAGSQSGCLDVDKLFQPFFTTKKRGMGMGLAICRSIIEVHGGRINAALTGPGAGLTVSIELPALTEGSQARCNQMRAS